MPLLVDVEVGVQQQGKWPLAGVHLVNQAADRSPRISTRIHRRDFGVRLVSVQGFNADDEARRDQRLDSG